MKPHVFCLRTGRLHPRRGVVLPLVLVVIVLLTLTAFTFSDLMLTERGGVKISNQQTQARLFAESGIDLVRYFLTQSKLDRLSAGGTYDNPEQFQGVMLLDDDNPKLRGRVSVLSPLLDEYGILGNVRYGLEDESARLNLNLLADEKFIKAANEQGAEDGRMLLLALPGMSVDTADAILDWLDSDDEPREYGAESEYYSQLDPPYMPNNGPLATVGELLLVRGVTPQLLYGLDANRNSTVDISEQGNEISLNVDSTDPEIARGWAAYLTLHSAENDVDSTGMPRISLKTKDMEKLFDDLVEVMDQQWAGFIVAYLLSENGENQQNNEGNNSPPGESSNGGNSSNSGGNNSNSGGGGSRGGSGGGNSESSGASPANGNNSSGASESGQQPNSNNNESAEELNVDKLDLTQQAKRELSQILDLIDAEVEVKYQGEDQPTKIENPFTTDPESMSQYLPVLMDYLTVSSEKTISGKININQAPRVILAGIPGMTEELLEGILAQRDVMLSGGDSNDMHPTWLLTKGLVDLEQMKKLSTFLNAGGDVFRSQVVGYFEAGGVSSRIEVILDATTTPARVVSWRDIGNLGRGYSLETLGADLTSRVSN